MPRLLLCLLFIGAAFISAPSTAVAQTTKSQAIQKDRKQIEGRWNIISLVADGKKQPRENIEKLIVVNQANGDWKLLSEGTLVSKGTSSIDPTKTPKTIDFSVTEGEGEGNQHVGIYKLGENTRQMCFARPADDRPEEFTSTAGSKHICVEYKRKQSE